MKKTVIFEGHSIEIDSSLGWLYRYREQFGHDIMPDLFPLVDAFTSGLGEFFDVLAVEDDKKYLDVVKAKDMIDGDVFFEMISHLAGMEVITVLNIFWAMAKNANRDIPSPEEFANQFDPYPVDEIAPGLLYSIANSSISRKNSNGLLEKMRERIPSISMWSQSQESTEG